MENNNNNRDNNRESKDSNRDRDSNRERPDNSRLFIGNLASEKTSKKELYDIFKQYGKIIEEIVIKRSFGFVQFDNPESAKAAMKGEQGRLVGDMRLDLNIADNREPRRKRRRSRSRSRSRDRTRSRSRTRSRDRTRSRSPRRRSRSRSPRYSRRRRSRTRSRDRDRTRSRSRSRSYNRNRKRSYTPERKDNSRVLKVLYLGEQQGDYAESIADIVKSKFGFGAATYFLDKTHIQDAISDAEREGYRYVIVVGRENFKNQTCRFNVLGKKRREQGISDISFNDVANTVAKYENITVPVHTPYPQQNYQTSQQSYQQYPNQTLNQNLLTNPLVNNLLSLLINQNPNFIPSLLTNPNLTGGQIPQTGYLQTNPTPNPTPNPYNLNPSLFPSIQNVPLQNLPNLQNFYVPQDNLNKQQQQNLQTPSQEELLRSQIQKLYNNNTPTNIIPNQNENPNYLNYQNSPSIPSQIQSILSSLQQGDNSGQIPPSSYLPQNPSQNSGPNDNNY